MDVRKVAQRDRKRSRRKYGMRIDGSSTRDIPRIQKQRLEWKKKLKEREKDEDDR